MLGLLVISLVGAPSSIDLATASPDAPAIELSWRGGIHAKAGGRIRFLGDGDDRPGRVLDFLGFVELHNQPDEKSIIPSQLWRGRLGVEGGYRWKLDGVVLRVTGLLEHESDHATVPSYEGVPVQTGFVNLNSVALKAGLRHGRLAPTQASITTRAHVMTCTRDPAACGEGGPIYGDPTFELEVSLSQERALFRPLERWNVFGALWGNGLIGTALVAPAKRFALRLGVIHHRSSDGLSLFFQALVGNDTGLFRQRDVVQFGAGFAWAPE